PAPAPAGCPPRGTTARAAALRRSSVVSAIGRDGCSMLTPISALAIPPAHAPGSFVDADGVRIAPRARTNGAAEFALYSPTVVASAGAVATPSATEIATMQRLATRAVTIGRMAVKRGPGGEVTALRAVSSRRCGTGAAGVRP